MSQGAGRGEREGLAVKAGLTLIELVVVIAIVLILGSLAVVEYGGQSEKAVRNDALILAKSLTKAMKMYKLDNDSQYPPTGNLTPLAGYIDHLTGIVEGHFVKTEITQDGTTGVGILGILKDMEDEYCVMVVAEAGGAVPFALSGAPFCRWGAVSGSCTGSVTGKNFYHDWQSCGVGL